MWGFWLLLLLVMIASWFFVPDGEIQLVSMGMVIGYLLMTIVYVIFDNRHKIASELKKLKKGETDRP